ncbi:alpha-hydroxy acid oxidase [Pollutimonas bauzanensis]|uniref:L-lactate dehydrogenase (Cytochrome) n=1 Tax=Pollutimonas bauzanensis TaxID=658167 RepID=A0A1M5YPZ3_9BURK|nr:alpha-hydroxy acid oxidase [Pollutimonas bauzanensis]SHI13603.1 L-lactate dehydrogenase (cytochrome) [Pollutimonas bauzanensis]
MKRSYKNITCIKDLQILAKRRVPRMFYEYVDCGSWDGVTYRANSDDFSRVRFRQRVGLNIDQRIQRCEMAGEKVAMPLAIAPTGLAGMQRADGEILAARAAERFGIPFTLSTMSICSIEDVAANTRRPFWFQLYVMRDRVFVKRLIERARDANCSALVLTLDLPVQGLRHKDIKNGLSTPPKLTLRNIVNMASRPGWCFGMMRTRRHSFRNIVGHVSGVSDISSMAHWVSEQFDQTMSWDDVRWIRRIWGRKLILKGIMDVADAEMAVQCGADALIVSNHGGRQLDGALSSIAVLPRIVEAVGERIEVLFDGGIQSGQDVLKAVALGAKGTFIGRSFLYGLGAMGEAGVTHCLEIIQKELDLTMALCGVTDITKVNTEILEFDHFPVSY